MRIEQHKISSNYWTQVFIPENTTGIHVNEDDGSYFLIGVGGTENFFKFRGCISSYGIPSPIGFKLFKAGQDGWFIDKTEFRLEFMIIEDKK